METSASCEEPMKEEVADSSKQGMQISSLLDTSLSDANTMSFSGVPVEMETSASKNNDLENVHEPVKKKVKRKRKRKRPDTSCEETVEVEAENIMLADKHKIEKDQNAQLRNQVAQLLQVEQEQKLQIRERDTTIQNLQAKIGGLQQQLNEALHSAESRSGSVPESNLKAAEDNVDSSTVLKKLVEELLKRDAGFPISWMTQSEILEFYVIFWQVHSNVEDNTLPALGLQMYSSEHETEF